MKDGRHTGLWAAVLVGALALLGQGCGGGGGSAGGVDSAGPAGDAESGLSASGPAGMPLPVEAPPAAGSEAAVNLPPAPPVTQRKYNPGHYIAINPWDKPKDVLNALAPGVSGVQIRYQWVDLEPAFDRYDFTAVRAELDLLASQGRQLIVMVEDKTFNGKIPTPPYLRAGYTAENRAGGYTAMRWHPWVVKRFSKLLTQLGSAFNDHPAFEGLAIQETALGLNDAVLDANGYTPQAYRDALIAMITSAAESMPDSNVFWYMNFLARNSGFIAEVADAVEPYNVIMGGPDVLPDDPSLQNGPYPLYDKFRGRLTLFCSVQYNSYSHVHANPGYATKYWTPQELMQFARDELHVSYLIWNRKVQADPADAYTWRDALPVIAANPVLNP